MVSAMLVAVNWAFNARADIWLSNSKQNFIS